MISSFGIVIRKDETIKLKITKKLNDLFQNFYSEESVKKLENVPEHYYTDLEITYCDFRFDGQESYHISVNWPISADYDLYKIEKNIIDTVTSIVKKYPEVLGVLIKLRIPHKDINTVDYLQINYNFDSTKHTITNFDKINAVYKEMIRNYPFIIIIDKTISLFGCREKGTTKYHITFKSNSIPEKYLVKVNKYLTKDNKKYSLINMGSRFQNMHSFYTGVDSWEEDAIIEEIKSKLEERGYVYISKTD